ncbi:hypothetical protein VTK73DRAFT_2600 [Phialemonium thermophilum]|uniref:catalase n=1 Tax=Phialemonium thermophilum TaxID=223376 RepID=A0ABR3X3M1_9PEZI
MKLDRNPTNYFAETEQIMVSLYRVYENETIERFHALTRLQFQPGHIVRGIDFTEDPLLQGRVFSYLDTQLNRHGGPNFEQLPINRPRVDVHNNNRDGAGQNLIHKNTHPCKLLLVPLPLLGRWMKALVNVFGLPDTPSVLSGGFPAQANQTSGRGFFTAPSRKASGGFVRELSSTFDDHWSQPRLFFNSLTTVEQQFLINAMRFETSHIQSEAVRKNVISQLNRVSNTLAKRVAKVLGLAAPAPDPKYYHNNKTEFISITNHKLPTIATLRVAVLVSVGAPVSLTQASQLKNRLKQAGVVVTVVGESHSSGSAVDVTYSAADASTFDGIIVADGAQKLFGDSKTASSSSLYPVGRPGQILLDGFRWGKPVGALGAASSALRFVGNSSAPGVYTHSNMDSFISSFKTGLETFKFVDRFPLDS